MRKVAWEAGDSAAAALGGSTCINSPATSWLTKQHCVRIKTLASHSHPWAMAREGLQYRRENASRLLEGEEETLFNCSEASQCIETVGQMLGTRAA